MKFTYKIIFLCLVISFTACEKLADHNIDPNNSPTARPQELLTSALGYTAWIVDGRYNELAFQWGQYWTWGPGVSLGNSARYIAEPDDHNNLWARCYSNALADLKVIGKSEDPAFSAVSKILTAYIYQGLVDHFDDIPYSEALNGGIEDGSVVAPKYDDAATIYADLVVQLDAAIESLGKATGNEIGAEDLLFGGDLGNWASFAKSLKLRILMRQSDVDGIDVSAQVTELIREGDFIDGSANIASMAFAGTSGDENPMFAVRESGIGNFYVASRTSLDLLEDLGDPRISALYDDAVNFPGEIIGIHHGAIDTVPFTKVRPDFSQGSAITYAADNPVIFMSPWEVWFLRAEAAAKYSTADDEATAFANGVAASFDFLGVADATGYTTTLGYDAGGSMNERMTHIGIQKWIACNGLQEDEGWIEARRFDTPDNPIFTDIDNGVFLTPLRTALAEGVHPSAFLYPQSEQNLNASSPTQRTLTDKVFWDK